MGLWHDSCLHNRGDKKRNASLIELSGNEKADELILNRLKRLHQDAKIVFKHNPQVANKFNFDHIMAIVTSI